MNEEMRVLTVMKSLLDRSSDSSSTFSTLASIRFDLVRRLDCADKEKAEYIKEQIEKLDALMIKLSEVLFAALQ